MRHSPDFSCSCMQSSISWRLVAWPSALAAHCHSPQLGRCQKHARPSSCITPSLQLQFSAAPLAASWLMIIALASRYAQAAASV